ncbi:GIY-YIG nuclease family protein [Streptomyces canus]|uniref:GIY-YIG nuclease family protein n=1 Tax=Streptomyces canus TaxID=58343 RepID=UPI002F90EED0|nr:GIY-YIG nuclease family protein [Streptomyces canus]
MRTTAPGARVYVIGGPGLPYVKIGTSGDPEARLRQLQSGSPVPLSVLWSTPGDTALERELHARFAAHRAHGEWFDLTPLGDPVSVVREAAREAALPAPALPAAYDCPDPEGCWGGTCLHSGEARLFPIYPPA